MRSWIVLTVLAIVPFVAWASDKDKTPSLYLSEEGQYRIAFPKEPSTSTRKLATVAGAIPVHSAKLEVKRGLHYAVTVTTYPESFNSAKPAKILDGVRDGMKSGDGAITSEKVITLGAEKWPGREIVIDAGSNSIRCQIFLVGNKLYQIQAVGSKDSTTTPSVNDFFTSFDLVRTK